LVEKNAKSKLEKREKRKSDKVEGKKERRMAAYRSW
jgi:hypothetical protein